MISVSEKRDYKGQVIFLYEDDSSYIPDEVLEARNISSTLEGKLYSVTNIYISNKFYVIVGLGGYRDLDMKKLKSVVAKSVKQMKKAGIEEYGMDITPFIQRFDSECLFHLVEGIKLGNYEFYGYKTDKKEYDYTVFLQGIHKDINQVKEIIHKAENIVDGIIIARDLVNAPANRLTPELLSQEVILLGDKAGFEVEILKEDELEELNMKAFLTVGSSSGNSPRLIVMRYKGDFTSDKVAGLVGKGVTCDTGGYCLKASNTMGGIKGDMAGGAAVIGVIYGLAMNKVKTNVVGIIPACENRISRESYIPGDVIDSMSGKTIEIINTDAEGRLILADAITYGIKVEGIDKVIDIATLTSAVVAALGFTTTGILTNNTEFYDKLIKASKKSGEQFWRFPIYDEYREMLKSDIADIKNMGKDYLGTVTAGLFIGSFAEKLPWIHMDIAGTAWVNPPVFQYQSEGATGAPVTSLYFLFGMGDE
ncbi:leucyl aminopeptidase [Vallitalea guaymasensis]|uniref:leucyl aminopeptidase n=1 Tax=Vallitalea guaymasensis TaxID=1185412 RepID=UPI000DE52262|nr:leucyl aminopeptidase [Vallitalea guaymasensis]